RAWNQPGSRAHRGYSGQANAFSRRAPSNGLEIYFISNKHCESHFSSAKTTQKKSCFLRAITAVPIRKPQLTGWVEVGASSSYRSGRNERHPLPIPPAPDLS